jgi:hypothetical protein
LEGVVRLAGHSLSFATLFASVESDDEEADGTARCYTLLRTAFGSDPFTAADAAGAIAGHGINDLTCEAISQFEGDFGEALKSAIVDAAGTPFEPGAVGAQQIAKKLQRFIGRPAVLDDGIFQLHRKQDRQNGNRYQITELRR